MQKQTETENRFRNRIPSLSERAFRGSELFENFDMNMIKFPDKIRGTKEKHNYCWKVFNTCMDMIINDLIDENIIFYFPTQKKVPAMFSVKLLEGEKFKKAYDAGVFPGLDFLKTNFTAPQLTYTYWNIKEEKNMPIVVYDENTKARIIENANNGLYN